MLDAQCVWEGGAQGKEVNWCRRMWLHPLWKTAQKWNNTASVSRLDGGPQRWGPPKVFCSNVQLSSRIHSRWTCSCLRKKWLLLSDLLLLQLQCVWSCLLDFYWMVLTSSVLMKDTSLLDQNWFQCGLITERLDLQPFPSSLIKATFTRSPFRFSSRCPAYQTLHGSDTKQELFTETTAACVCVCMRVCLPSCHICWSKIFSDLLHKGRKMLRFIHQRAKPQKNCKSIERLSSVQLRVRQTMFCPMRQKAFRRRRRRGLDSIDWADEQLLRRQWRHQHGVAGGDPDDAAGKTLTCQRRICLERRAAVGDNSWALKKKNSLLWFVP